MIDKSLNLNEPHEYVSYCRYSTTDQNERSNDQQNIEIDRTIARNSFPWKCIKRFEDSGISGKKSFRRPGFAEMIGQIKRGEITPSFILVDTKDRFSRSSDIDAIEHELLRKYGVYVLAANRNFLPPDSTVGILQNTFDNVRSREENEIKAYMVMRGKRDSVRLGFWPGGKPPIGFQLVAASKEVRSRRGSCKSKVVVDPTLSWIPKMVFRLADELHMGSTLIARTMNDMPEFRQLGYKFGEHQVLGMLKNPLYKGVMIYGIRSTDVIDDCRVVAKNDEDCWTVVEGFCEQIVDADLWERANANIQRRAKARQRKVPRTSNRTASGRIVPGLTLKYLLAGLAVCGYCGRAMVISSTSPYLDKSGNTRVYANYRCPGNRCYGCPNNKSFDANWLTQVVVDTVLGHLGRETGNFVESDEFTQLCDQVENELVSLRSGSNVGLAALEAQQADLQRQIDGWQATLGKPEISSTLRDSIEQLASKAFEQLAGIRKTIDSIRRSDAIKQKAFDPSDVQSRIERLGSILATDCPTAANVELAKFVDKIICHPDGRIVQRICKFGLLPDLAEMFAYCGGNKPDDREISPVIDDNSDVQTRRRTRRRIDDIESAEFACDIDRFAGFADHWFWIDEHQMPDKRCWSDQHAMEVYRAKFEDGMTFTQMAKHFGVSKPTLQRAIKVAKEQMKSDSDSQQT